MATLHEAEGYSLDRLRTLQLHRLRAVLAHMQGHSAFYRGKLEAAGVHPDDCASLEDLGKFPFTQKTDFRDNYPFGMFCVPREQVVRLHASSGTTGKPTVVGYTRNDIEVWSDLVARSIHAAGGRPGDLVHISYGYGLFTGGLGAHYGAERLGCTVVPVSGGQTGRQVQLIKDLDPDIIMVTPSYMLNLADELEAQGVDTAKLRLRCGIFGAESWTGSMRERLQERLHIQALDIYGLSEVMGPGVAQEYADSADGLTIWEDHFLPEIIDPESGEVLPDGQMGELVLTTLSKEALPVLRYRTGDLTRLLPGQGRAMRRIDKISGRSDDMMIIRGVNLFPTQIEEQILALASLSPHFLLERYSKGNLQSLLVKVERRDESAKTGIDEGEQLRQRIKSHLGISVDVEVLPPQSLPRSEGKAVRVVARE